MKISDHNFSIHKFDRKIHFNAVYTFVYIKVVGQILVILLNL